MKENFQKFSIEVPRPPLSTEIIIGKNILDKIPEVINLSPYMQFVIITEKRLELQFGSKLKEGLQKTGKPVHIFTSEGSESNKTEEEADRILARIVKIKPEIDRKLLILALGGGVMGDLGGYVASRILRGIDCDQLPTTFLGMTDSAHGGKTGVDFEGIKNMIGSFHLPRATIMDIDVLKSLPERQITSGFAEFVKHAFLDEKIFKFISGEDAGSIMKDDNKLTEGLKLSAEYKMSVVSQDYEEKTGVRKRLNLGHTLGHALETATNLTDLTHGEAVAIGMKGAILMSHMLGLLPTEDAKDMLSVMARFNLPTSASGIDKDLLWKIMKHDKKSVNGVPRFVLLEGIGKPKIDCQVDTYTINEVLEKIIS